ncbi:hypothetical protein HJFPF1_08182 [Paramyrothecium foliicola]|nr:hypothetical protein HJFPF1_08182 [Paramyrothecium foliicola]
MSIRHNLRSYKYCAYFRTTHSSFPQYYSKQYKFLSILSTMQWTKHDSDDEDERTQPWKEWVEEELKARRDADKTEEGRRKLEERIKAYKARQKGTKSGGDGGNKAG